ncbi:hypothetical protein H5410_024982 [Solanum commersonii]|uniref:Uncharacterized protein n=1 Tax=Solanum commersonii TaxID=4109 RepID=A0A9J5YSY5_SOLCO|nr:hypothetical protein H5410_024982 [Solanum commersonii]
MEWVYWEIHKGNWIRSGLSWALISMRCLESRGLLVAYIRAIKDISWVLQCFVYCVERRLLVLIKILAVCKNTEDRVVILLSECVGVVAFKGFKIC